MELYQVSVWSGIDFEILEQGMVDTPNSGQLYVWKDKNDTKIHGPFKSIVAALEHRNVFLLAKQGDKENVIFVNFLTKRRIA